MMGTSSSAMPPPLVETKRSMGDFRTPGLPGFPSLDGGGDQSRFGSSADSHLAITGAAEAEVEAGEGGVTLDGNSSASSSTAGGGDHTVKIDSENRDKRLTSVQRPSAPSDCEECRFVDIPLNQLERVVPSTNVPYNQETEALELAPQLPDVSMLFPFRHATENTARLLMEPIQPTSFSLHLAVTALACRRLLEHVTDRASVQCTSSLLCASSRAESPSLVYEEC